MARRFKEISPMDMDYYVNQFKVFKEKTGIDFEDGAKDFIKGINDELENKYQQNPQEYANNISVGIFVDDVFANKSKELFDKVVRIYNNKNEKMTDEQFVNTTEALFDMMSKISMALKHTNEKIQKVESCKNRLGGLIPESYNQYYETLTGKSKFVGRQYNEEIMNIKNGKSERLCDDMQQALTSNNAEKASIVYMALEKKQKRNSFFTNWLSPKGYRERKAMKLAKQKLMQDKNITTELGFFNYVNDKYYSHVKPCDDFHKTYTIEYGTLFHKTNKPLDNYLKYKGAINPEQWLNNEVKMVKEDKKLIEVDMGPVIGENRPSFENSIDEPVLENEITK